MVSHEEQQLIYTPLSQPASPVTSYHDAVLTALAERRTAWNAAITELLTRTRTLTEATSLLIETLRTGHKVLVAGNGGSAAEAQHFAAELVGRFKRERTAYAVMALTTDTSIITAVANDYGFQDIFARQVQAFGRPDDLFIAFSTSGESENIVRAAALGLRQAMKVVAVTGAQPSRLERLANVTIRVPAIDTPTVQELHMAITHILCDITETELAAWEGGAS